MNTCQSSSPCRFLGLSPRSVAVLGVILAAALGLRCYSITARSIWMDEALSWRLSRFPLPEMIARIGGDNHPPLYFLMLKGWTGLFGDSLAGLRSLSVVLGCLTCLGVFLFGREVFSERTGLLAAALFALSAFQIRFAWETRMYALVTALCIFSAWALFRALNGPAGVRWWALFGLLDLLLIYAHYYGLFIVAAQALFVAVLLLARAVRQPSFAPAARTFLGPSVAAAIMIAGWLPWLPSFFRQKSQVQEYNWCRPVGRWDVPRLCYQMFIAPENLPPTPRPHYLAPAGLCLFGLACLLRRGRAGEWYVFCLAVGPLLECLLAETMHIKVFALRYFIPSHLFLLIGLAILIDRISFPAERSLATAVVLAGSLALFLHFCAVMDVRDRPGTRAATDWIDRQRQPGEPVVAASSHSFFPALYHAANRADYWLYVSGRIPHFLGASSLKNEERLDPEDLQQIAARRVWVINATRGHVGDVVVPVPPEWVVQGEKIIPDVFGVGTLIVLEYATKPHAAPLGH